MKRAALIGAALLALAGCKAVGPDYHLPQDAAIQRPAAQGAFQSAPAALTISDPLPQRWWHLYDDPVLDGLEEQALAANTDLRVAAANLARARAITAVAEGGREPDFSVSAGAQHTRLSGQSYLQSEQLPVADIGDVGAEMSYQIDLFGRIRRQVEASRADEEALAAIEDAVKVTVAADVARAYVGVCAAHAAEDLAQRAITLQGHLVDINRRLVAAGRSATPDVTAAQGRLAQAQAVLPTYRAAARAALYRLAALTGKVPADYPREAESCRAVPQLRVPLPVGDGAALLRRRPDVRAAERQLAGATARIGVATADLYPSIGIGLSGGSTGFVKDLGLPAANRWSIGGLLHWTIPTAGARARVRAADANADAALARFDGVVLGALRETETALATYAENHDRHVALDQALALAQTQSDQARRLREAGRAAITTDIGGRQGVIGAEAATLNSRAEIANDQVNLFLALGGGW